MTDKDYNTHIDTYKTIPIEERQIVIKNENINNIVKQETKSDDNSEKYFKDEEKIRRTDSYDTIDKIDNDNLEKKDHNRLLPLRTHSYVGHIDEAPKFSRDNEFILRGYRVNFHTCKTIAKSLCLCHNETVNVWTHLVGALFTILLIIITGVTVGPYGSSVNQPWRSEKRKTYFEKYSVPIYSTIPLFHNSRIYLTYLNNSFRTILKNNKTTNHNEINNNRTEYFLMKSLEDYSNLYDKLNRLEEDFINCSSCIEDFSRNLYTIKDFLDEALKNVEESNKIITGTWKLNQDIKEKIKSFQVMTERIINLLSNKVRIIF
jgi:hypothetical protein